MRKQLSIALAVAVTQPTPAAAADPPGLAGVWDGTIGDLPIRACFDVPGESDTYGVYFYRSKLVTIPLIRDAKTPLLFSEGWPDDAKAPRWALTQASSNEIGGTWKQGSRSLPLRLKRVAVTGDDSPCSSMEFEQPRLEGLRIVQSPAVKDGVHYTKLALDHRGHFGDMVSVESFTLPGDGPAVRAINAVLKKPFDRNGEDSWLGCVRMAYPWGGEHHESFEPRMITRKWLVVNHHWDGFCGGAHPDSSNDPRLFDLATGAEVNLYSWFNDKAVKREHYEGEAEDIITLQPAFKAVLMGRWKGDEECDNAIRSEDFWHVELTRTGFKFTPELAHVVQACEEDFNLSFAKAAPFLNPNGKTQVAALEAESAGKR